MPFGLPTKKFHGLGAPQVDHSTNYMKKVRRRLTNKQVEWGGNAAGLTNEEVLWSRCATG